MSADEMRRDLADAHARVAVLELELLGARQVIAAHRERDTTQVTA